VRKETMVPNLPTTKNGTTRLKMESKALKFQNSKNTSRDSSLKVILKPPNLALLDQEQEIIVLSISKDQLKNFFNALATTIQEIRTHTNKTLVPIAI
jgi:hypothetical protein